MSGKVGYWFSCFYVYSTEKVPSFSQYRLQPCNFSPSYHLQRQFYFNTRLDSNLQIDLVKNYSAQSTFTQNKSLKKTKRRLNLEQSCK